MLTAVLPGNAAADGPLKTSANGRYFVDQTGRPFFWLGDTAWALFTQCSMPQTEHYLKVRSEMGFTVIQAVLAWGNGSGSETPKPLPNQAGQKPWLNDNPATPNEAYFKYVEQVLEYARQQGLVMALLPTWGYYVNDAKLLTTHNARAYGQWLGERFRAIPNLVWVNGGDRVPSGFEPVYRELALGLRQGDGGAHLITYHPCGWKTSSQYFHQESWLDFNMIETWSEWAKVYPAVQADTLLTPNKPVVLGEGAYEGGDYPHGKISPLIVRRQAWWTFMAGGSHTYGESCIWPMAADWEKHLDTPGARQVCLMKAILEKMKWWDMSADQSVFSTGVSSERTLNTAVRFSHSDAVLIYLASQCSFFVHLDKIASGETRATWINPINGDRKDAGTYPTGNREGKGWPAWQIQSFTLPFHWEDALLLLEGN
jgi:hypothetical protein